MIDQKQSIQAGRVMNSSEFCAELNVLNEEIWPMRCGEIVELLIDIRLAVNGNQVKSMKEGHYAKL